MSGPDKRKFIKEIKNEMKPFITALCEFSINKQTSQIKMGMRKMEGDITALGQRLQDKIEREFRRAKDENNKNLEDLIIKLENEIKMIYKAMARNKTDTNLQHKKANNCSEAHTQLLVIHDNYFDVMAQIQSNIIENLNI